MVAKHGQKARIAATKRRQRTTKNLGAASYKYIEEFQNRAHYIYPKGVYSDPEDNPPEPVAAASASRNLSQDGSRIKVEPESDEEKVRTTFEGEVRSQTRLRQRFIHPKIVFPDNIPDEELAAYAWRPEDNPKERKKAEKKRRKAEIKAQRKADWKAIRKQRRAEKNLERTQRWWDRLQERKQEWKQEWKQEKKQRGQRREQEQQTKKEFWKKFDNPTAIKEEPEERTIIKQEPQDYTTIKQEPGEETTINDGYSQAIPGYLDQRDIPVPTLLYRNDPMTSPTRIMRGWSDEAITAAWNHSRKHGQIRNVPDIYDFHLRRNTHGTGVEREMDPQDHECCLSIVNHTSSAAYKVSSIGWHVPSKRLEMKDKDMIYLLVRTRDGHPGAFAKRDFDTGIVAFISFKIDYDDPPNDQQQVVYIYEVHIAEKLRGQGLGRWLMFTVEAMAQSITVNKTMLTVFRSNEGARKAYESMGYGEDRSSPSGRVVRGRAILSDYIIMSKRWKSLTGEIMARK